MLAPLVRRPGVRNVLKTARAAAPSEGAGGPLSCRNARHRVSPAPGLTGVHQRSTPGVAGRAWQVLGSRAMSRTWRAPSKPWQLLQRTRQRCRLAAPIALAAALTPTPALTNDATFGGAGADLVPLAEQRVQLKSEDIRLTSKGYEWLIDATYVFYNPGELVKVQVGFPEYRCEEGFDCNNVAFSDLETTVDGVRVEHRQGQLEKGSG